MTKSKSPQRSKRVAPRNTNQPTKGEMKKFDTPIWFPFFCAGVLLFVLYRLSVSPAEELRQDLRDCVSHGWMVTFGAGSTTIKKAENNAESLISCLDNL